MDTLTHLMSNSLPTGVRSTGYKKINRSTYTRPSVYAVSLQLRMGVGFLPYSFLEQIVLDFTCIISYI